MTLGKGFLDKDTGSINYKRNNNELYYNEMFLFIKTSIGEQQTRRKSHATYMTKDLY